MACLHAGQVTDDFFEAAELSSNVYRVPLASNATNAARISPGTTVEFTIGYWRKSALAPNRVAWRAHPGAGRSDSSRTQTPWGRNVWQRGDIDWALRRPDGLTNLEAAQKGYSPLRQVWKSIRGSPASPLNQDVNGGLAEVWAFTHRQVNHNVPPPSWRMTDPAAAAAFRRETPSYWRWRAGQVTGE